MASELQYALRRLRRSPAFTITAVTSLSLALGATIALFILVDTVLLRPLAYPEPDRLVSVRNRVDGLSPTPWGLSQAQYFDFEQHASSLERIGVYVTNQFAFADSEGAERVPAALVTASVFDVLQVRPLLGRLIRDDEARPGASSAVLLGHDFWVRRFGADPNVVGRSIQVESRSREVVGVLPPGFDLPDRKTAIWLGLPLDRAAPPVNSHFLTALARVRPGTSVPQARAELEHLVRRFPDIFPRAYTPSFMRDTRFTPDVVPLHEAVVGEVRRALWVIFGSAGLVLLIACANVANLFLVRMQDHWHELEVRTALGAESRHLVHYTLSEALVLTLTAGAVGVLLADMALDGLPALEAVRLPRIDQVAVGWRAVLFTVALSAMAGIALAVMPLVRMRKGRCAFSQLHRGLTSSRDAVRTRNALVISQVALTIVLVASGGLMARSFANLVRVDPGFDPSDVLAIEVSLPAVTYPTHQHASRFYEALIERIRALPGVASAGATSALPLAAGGGCAALFVEDAPLRPNENPPCLAVRRVTPGYFESLRIPVRGATPGWSETNAEQAGVVITRALAHRFWPGQDAMGKGIRGNGWARPFYRVVGIAEDVREAGLNEPPVEAAYFPMIPMQGAPLWVPPRSVTVVVRVHAGDPAAFAGVVRGVMNQLDRSVPLGSVTTMMRVVDRSMARTTLMLLLLGIAAAVALLLGTIGLYGVLAYTVSRKQREIGIRTALGCGRGKIAQLIVRQALAVTGAGVVIGILAAALTTRVLEKLLFGVSPIDPATFVAACVLLMATALLASYVPARRAASLDPTVVLRAE
jgi:putative ABC transport system permease protein